MKLSNVFSSLIAFASATHEPQAILESPQDVAHRIPTSFESAVMGRRTLALSKLATLSTVFPTDSGDKDADASERRPSGLGGVPIGMMDYVADCEDDGNPTILAIKIATSFKNVVAGSNISLSMRWTPPYPPAHRISYLSRLTSLLPFYPSSERESPYRALSSTDNTPDPVPYSAANLPRFSLLGYLEPINPGPLESMRLSTCFVQKHRDAKYWLPGNAIHEASWARLVVTQVYWVGGFGDRAYIGWIPVEEWRNVTQRDWRDIQLPGEKAGWSEWTVDAAEL
ncbi:pyridoxamine 5'-phosphate oxidase domain-containing protein [Sarocladium implicatum]|nr:pyridoxamine 5'-phosphate oxidase domain-containing protein [Sarocladium implicatum]